MKKCAAATTDPVPNLLMLEGNQQETTTTPHVHSDVNQFHGKKNSNNSVLNIGNNQLQLISCEEVAFEPGFSVSLPLMFLESFHHSIGLATAAWVEVPPDTITLILFMLLLISPSYPRSLVSVSEWKERGKGSSSQWMML